jgi:hypothetical protein
MAYQPRACIAARDKKWKTIQEKTRGTLQPEALQPCCKIGVGRNRC